MARKTNQTRRLERAEELVSDLWTPAWVCPTCGRPFAQLDQSHSCGRELVRRYLDGKPRHALVMYRRFAELIRGCGPVAIVASRTGIAFHVRSAFAAIDSLTANALSAHVVLRRRYDHPRFTRVQVRSPQHQLHYFRAATPDELDEEVATWLGEAYLAANPSKEPAVPRART